ncbi:MAG: L-seryl-tRNA(Sec) selenium transferase [Oscillospiraceae bacterium]
MRDGKAILRGIPKVDDLLRQPLLAELPAAAVTVTAAVREVLDGLRAGVLAGSVEELPSMEALCQAVREKVRLRQLPSLRGVINGTGVTLHTNLGRACLSRRAADAARAVSDCYSTLEYNVEKGARGLRYAHVEALLQQVTGAEAALVVNNNAAAVLLILTAMAKGGEVITSRGELVEIGGSFRVPEIMESSGCRLKEVGATNKTHLRDYANAIGEDTRALLKVHTSNFKILGFTETVPLADLVALGHDRGLPVIEDLGSGSLVELEQFGIHDEPTVQASVRAGVDVISFSGDKLLGGPQAGIIIGKREMIDTLARHPLTRALRVDKMTLAALEATLRSYAEGREKEEIPTLAMLAATEDELRARATLLCDRLTEIGVRATVVPESDQVGGGSVPTQLLPTFAVAIAPQKRSVDGLEEALRRRDTPIIGRISHDRYLLDARTLREADFLPIVTALAEIGEGAAQ